MSEGVAEGEAPVYWREGEDQGEHLDAVLPGEARLDAFEHCVELSRLVRRVKRHTELFTGTTDSWVTQMASVARHRAHHDHPPWITLAVTGLGVLRAHLRAPVYAFIGICVWWTPLFVTAPCHLDLSLARRNCVVAKRGRA